MNYQGHKNKVHWNVCLWLNNDESLYRLCQDALRRNRTKARAAQWLLASLPEKTPDGYRYSLSAVRAALVGF